MSRTFENYFNERFGIDFEASIFDETEAANSERIEKYKIKSTQLDSKHSAYHTMAKMPKEFNTSFYEEHSYLLADDTSPVVMLSDWMESGEGQLLLVAAPPKRGKTHLLTMIYESLRNCFPNKKIIFGDAEPVLSEVREMIAEDVCNPIGKLADNDILLLDNCSNIGETVEADRKILKKCADKITGEKGGICVFAFSTEGLNELDDIESLVNGIMCDDKTSFIYMLDDDKVMKHCCAVEYAEKNGYLIDETELDLIATRAGSIAEVKEMISTYCSEQAKLIPGQNEQTSCKTRAKDALSAFYDNTGTQLKLRAKRIKRSVQNWIDPEFDWNKYAERECLTEDGCDYYIADKKIFNDTEYTLFINVDDAEDMVFRKSIMIDGEEYYAGLDDDAEFDVVWEKFFPASRKAEAGKHAERTRKKENRLYIKNTYSKVLYVIANLYWLLMAILMYNPLLCSPLPGLSEEASYIVFWSMIALMMVVGVVAAFPRRRNSGSILANVMLPIGLYTLIAYYNMHSVFAQFTISAAAVLAIEFTSAVIKVKTSKITGKEVSIGNRLRHAFHGSRVIVAFCLTVFAVVMWICAFAGLYSS